eukprot:1034390-Lingulodinium_polyedra.AAC.1
MLKDNVAQEPGWEQSQQRRFKYLEQANVGIVKLAARVAETRRTSTPTSTDRRKCAFCVWANFGMEKQR